jgi:hypothetical protein
VKRALLIMAVAVAGLACVRDRSCRDNTVLVQVEFADSRDCVDGVALKVVLDNAPAVDLNPIARPPGVDQGGLELAVQNYASYKRLTLQYATTKAGNVVGPWQEKVVEIKPGCTAVDLMVAIGGDAGPAEALDASLAIDAQADGIDAHVDATVDARADTAIGEARVDTLLSGDSAPDVPFVMSEVGVDAAPEYDVPAAPGGDAPAESAASVDLPVIVPNVDAAAAQDLPSDPAPDATRDAVPEVSAGPGTEQAACLIDSTAYTSGVANPVNPCQTCQPALSGSTWTNLNNGTGCGSGQVCSVGLCRLGCWLDGSYYPAAATKPGSACQYCNPALSVGAWTKENDGTSCGSGQVCNAGLCGTGCWISSTFYASGAVNPANACQTCQPGTADTAWSNSTNGASCGTGQVCNSATCNSGCWIDSALYGSGVAKPGNACQTCQPGVSTTAWTNITDGLGCGSGEVCSGGTCGDCVPGTTQCKDASTQQVCQASRTWRDNTLVCSFECNSSSGTCYPQCTPNTFGCSTSTQPQQCNASGTWQNLTGCSAGMECVAGSGKCLKSNGQSCGGAAECAGNVCKNGFCCSSACTGLCQSCGLSGFEGTCKALPDATTCFPPNAKTAACQAGKCGVSSCNLMHEGRYLDCDGDGENGCETNNFANTSCGACGRNCATICGTSCPSAGCAQGQCICASTGLCP